MTGTLAHAPETYPGAPPRYANRGLRRGRPDPGARDLAAAPARRLRVVHEPVEVRPQRRGRDAARLEDRARPRVVEAHAHGEIREVDRVRREQPPRAARRPLLDDLADDRAIRGGRHDLRLARRETLAPHVDGLPHGPGARP